VGLAGSEIVNIEDILLEVTGGDEEVSKAK
jgi:hypothetical protein